jgi:hypothetical protein
MARGAPEEDDKMNEANREMDINGTPYVRKDLITPATATATSMAPATALVTATATAPVSALVSAPVMAPATAAAPATPTAPVTHERPGKPAAAGPLRRPRSCGWCKDRSNGMANTREVMQCTCRK